MVGFRLTQGLASRDGIAPLNAACDVGGPIAWTVEDAVAVRGCARGVAEVIADAAGGPGSGPRPTVQNGRCRVIMSP
jgi:Asp-tRNA(Asn)/Glu-tRNA(Gln) amidotransferase A subunit family amidase